MRKREPLQILIRRMDGVADMLMYFLAITLQWDGYNCKHRDTKVYFCGNQSLSQRGNKQALLRWRLALVGYIWKYLIVLWKLVISAAENIYFHYIPDILGIKSSKILKQCLIDNKKLSIKLSTLFEVTALSTQATLNNNLTFHIIHYLEYLAAEMEHSKLVQSSATQHCVFHLKLLCMHRREECLYTESHLYGDYLDVPITLWLERESLFASHLKQAPG